MHAWAFSSFPSKSKNKLHRLVDDSRCACDWAAQRQTGILLKVRPSLHPNTSWDRLQQASDSKRDKAGLEIGWMLFSKLILLFYLSLTTAQWPILHTLWDCASLLEKPFSYVLQSTLKLMLISKLRETRQEAVRSVKLHDWKMYSIFPPP